ncbi:hypothetical protein COBT_002063, partial [Conglomerata obtusa]
MTNVNLSANNTQVTVQKQNIDYHTTEKIQLLNNEFKEIKTDLNHICVAYDNLDQQLSSDLEYSSANPSSQSFLSAKKTKLKNSQICRTAIKKLDIGPKYLCKESTGNLVRYNLKQVELPELHC